MRPTLTPRARVPHPLHACVHVLVAAAIAIAAGAARADGPIQQGTLLTLAGGQVQGHLGRFGFSGEEVQRKADTLSGGERARVALAMLMLSLANFVLLDEPTNHLDVESVEALEDALDGFEGSVLLVSHDRPLLRNLATRVWALEDGTITDYPGSFEEWEADRVARAEAEARRASEERRILCT